MLRISRLLQTRPTTLTRTLRLAPAAAYPRHNFTHLRAMATTSPAPAQHAQASPASQSVTYDAPSPFVTAKGNVLDSLLPGYVPVPAAGTLPAYAVFGHEIETSPNDDRAYRCAQPIGLRFPDQ